MKTAVCIHIEKTLEQRGIKKKELAEAMGKDEKNLMRGLNSNRISLDFASKVCRALDIDLRDLDRIRMKELKK